MRISLIVLAALLLVRAAAAAGPWLGTAPAGLGYTAVVRGGATAVGDGAQSISVSGKWGLPRVTMNDGIGGLSTDKRVLVLAQAAVDHGNGVLSRRSSFLVLGTKPLHVVRTMSVRGDFGFDALSPNGRTLYLIEHVSMAEYRVRAYDLASSRLLARVIADKRQAGWNMTGYPVARAASADGSWVYTLYQQGDNYPFVHALDAVHKTAVCIGLPWAWTGVAGEAITSADLRVTGGKLVIEGNHGAGARFALNMRTFKVTRM